MKYCRLRWTQVLWKISTIGLIHVAMGLIWLPLGQYRRKLLQFVSPMQAFHHRPAHTDNDTMSRVIGRGEIEDMLSAHIETILWKH
jgi:hypothetical protein